MVSSGTGLKRDKIHRSRRKTAIDSYLAVWCFGELLNSDMMEAIPCNNNTNIRHTLRKMANSFYKKIIF
jgi:hypothetical protein